MNIDIKEVITTLLLSLIPVFGSGKGGAISRLSLQGLCLLVLASLGFVGKATADDSVRRENKIQVEDWVSYDSLTTMQDGTSLFAYVAETKSFNTGAKDEAEHNSVYRFSFLPRFECSPLIILAGLLPPEAVEEDRIESLRNFNKIKLAIDGEPIAFPALVERQSQEVLSFYNANLQRRTTLRILTELGSIMKVEFGNGSMETYSLLGSRKVIEQALGRCKNHG